MNIGQLLGGLGAGYSGWQDNQDWNRKKETEDLSLKQLKDQLARDPMAAKVALDFLSQQGQKPAIPPPPPPAQRPPEPGQASVPMQQPRQNMMGPPGDMPMQNRPPIPPPPPQGGMPPAVMNPPPPSLGRIPPEVQMQRDQYRLQVLQEELRNAKDPVDRETLQREISRLSGIAPYRAMPQANSSPMPQNQPQGPQSGSIPQPPQQQEVPQPNSMTISDAARFIKSRGVNDPMVAMQALEKLTPYLNQEAKQEAMMLRHQVQMMQAEEKVRRDKALEAGADKTRDMKAPLIAAQTDKTKNEAGVVQQNSDARTTTAEAQKSKAEAMARDAGGKLTPSAITYWQEVLRNGGSLPPRMGKGDIAQIMEGVATAPGQVTPLEFIQNKAETAGKTSAQRALGTQSANVQMAGKEYEASSKIAKEVSATYDRTSFPKVNEAINFANTQTGDPKVRAFGASINTLVNTYARAINPKGVGTVSDKEHARELLSKADGPAAFKAVLDILDREVAAAEKVASQVKADMRKTNTTKEPLVFSSADEVNAAVKAGKIKKGEKFVDPNGTEHTVN